MLDKGPSGLKVLAIVINAKVNKAFDCSGDKNLGSYGSLVMTHIFNFGISNVCFFWIKIMSVFFFGFFC